VNGYFKFPNGDFYPRNLFEKITQITSRSGDEVGEAVIRTAFRDPDSFNTSVVDFPVIDDNSTAIVTKYLGILSGAVFNVENTEISQLLAVAHQNLDLNTKKNFPDALGYLQKALNIRGIKNIADIPKTTAQIVNLFSNLRKNDAVYQLLESALNLTTPEFNQNILTGYSYNVFQDAPLTVSPFDLGDLKNSEIGYKFPASMTCVTDAQSVDIMRFLLTRQQYLDERIKTLGIGGRVPIEHFSGVTKLGYNVEEEILNLSQTSSSGTDDDQNSNNTARRIALKPITAVRELRTFELVLNDQFQLSTEFKDALKLLTPYNESDAESVEKWKSFFDTYGTHVVKSVYGGGAIQIEIKSDTPYSAEISKVLLSLVQFAEDMSIGKVGGAFATSPGIEHSVRFLGGETDPRASEFTRIPVIDAANLLEKWKDSLSFTPTILTSEMKLLPLSEIVKKQGQKISSEIARATELYFNASLVYVKPSRMAVTPAARENTAELESATKIMAEMMGKMMEASSKSNERFEKMMMEINEGRERTQQWMAKQQEEQV